ncbi:MAG: phosphodiester glycosidase family protein [Coleofasciculaceae cyanobacterium SM2_1_6]|nr:phosphodiester glycosidase family protein [Coleofasciculaceae cyanobacterium SM2_1_6]
MVIVQKQVASQDFFSPDVSSQTPQMLLSSLVDAPTIAQGNQVSLNGRILSTAWQQWQTAQGIRIGVSDMSFRQMTGVELRNNPRWQVQPVEWFGIQADLNVRVQGQYRYLDITDLLPRLGWRSQATGNILTMTTPVARVANIRQGRQPWGDRLVIDLDQPAVWQMRDNRSQVVLTLKANTDSQIRRLFRGSDNSRDQIAGDPGQPPSSNGKEDNCNFLSNFPWFPLFSPQKCRPQNSPTPKPLFNSDNYSPLDFPNSQSSLTISDQGLRFPSKNTGDLTTINLEINPKDLSPSNPVISSKNLAINIATNSLNSSKSNFLNNSPSFSNRPPQIAQGLDPRDTEPPRSNPSRLVAAIASQNNQTTLTLNVPTGRRVEVFSLGNPQRLVVDLRNDRITERQIQWADGLQHQVRNIAIPSGNFPVFWLELEPKVKLRAIWSDPNSMTGTSPLITMAQTWQVPAAINAGFFNRNVTLPIGAMRKDGTWLSGPVLQRGAVGWKDGGEMIFDRLILQETLVTAQRTYPIPVLNSAYSPPGIARYSPPWGATYTNLADGETIVTVSNNQVINRNRATAAGQSRFPIPRDGYILVGRGEEMLPLSVGTPVQLTSQTNPPEFADYPQIMGGGPLLIKNSQSVLNAGLEQFGAAFNNQQALRSFLARSSSGNILLGVIGGRAGGNGPSLPETVQILQRMGAVDALNLDGGSSTSLYLGGELLDRDRSTAARVHNALGVVLQ